MYQSFCMKFKLHIFSNIYYIVTSRKNILTRQMLRAHVFFSCESFKQDLFYKLRCCTDVRPFLKTFVFKLQDTFNEKNLMFSSIFLCQLILMLTHIFFCQAKLLDNCKYLPIVDHLYRLSCVYLIILKLQIFLRQILCTYQFSSCLQIFLLLDISYETSLMYSPILLLLVDLILMRQFSCTHLFRYLSYCQILHLQSHHHNCPLQKRTYSSVISHPVTFNNSTLLGLKTSLKQINSNIPQCIKLSLLNLLISLSDDISFFKTHLSY